MKPNPPTITVTFRPRSVVLSSPRKIDADLIRQVKAHAQIVRAAFPSLKIKFRNATR